MANKKIVIENRDDLREWLENKPPEWAQLIAARTALRVMPLIWSVPARQTNARAVSSLLMFRALHASWAMSSYPNITSLRQAAENAASVNFGGHFATPPAVAALAAVQAASSYLSISNDRTNVADVANAAETAGDAVRLAAIYNATADKDTADAKLWNSICADAVWLERLNETEPANLSHEFVDMPLWLTSETVSRGFATAEGATGEVEPVDQIVSVGNVPEIARVGIANMSDDPVLNVSGFAHWVAWYRALVPIGKKKPSSYFGEKLDIQIATQPDEWWERDITEVNADIAEWLRKPEDWTEKSANGWDFFISYSSKDESLAREIDAILQASGHSTYAQFRDFGPGSNLVREMQHGLAGAGRVIALYSPDYEASDHCQAEWSAAYNLDPGGAKRKLLPFMLRPTELNPLARQIVYKSLVGLSADERRRAILEAIEYRPQRRGADQLKSALAEVASPEVVITEDGKIDAGANRALDLPVVDNDLANLPEMQRAIAYTIRGSLPANAPKIVSGIFGTYRDHLAQRGTQPIVGLLQQLGDALRAEYDSEEFEYWGDGVASLFQSFFANHELLITHFPFSEEREQVFSETDVDEDAASGSALSEPLDDVREASEELSNEDHTTPEFDKTLDTLAQIGRDMASLPTRAPTSDDPPNKITPKKRYILGAIGFLVTLYGVVGSTASIATTSAGAAFLGVVAEAIEQLMKFVTF